MNTERIILNLMALSGLACVRQDWGAVLLYETELTMYGVDSALREML